jgi:hypothetical protein
MPSVGAAGALCVKAKNAAIEHPSKEREHMSKRTKGSSAASVVPAKRRASAQNSVRARRSIAPVKTGNTPRDDTVFAARGLRFSAKWAEMQVAMEKAR